jgi:hypothetical protein
VAPASAYATTKGGAAAQAKAYATSAQAKAYATSAQAKAYATSRLQKDAGRY